MTTNREDTKVAVAKAILLTLVVIASCWFGYLAAHGEISRECQRLGGFYVGDKTFACEVKTK